MIMFKVTNSGIYEKVVLKIRGKSVYYLVVNKFDGTEKTQREQISTRYHDWTETRATAEVVYKQRTGK